MITHNFPDASKIPSKYREMLVYPQIHCWWSEPHGEYKICDDDSCRRIISIEEIHGVKWHEQIHNEHSRNFSCPECQGSTSFFYEPNEFLSAIEEFISESVSSVLISSDSLDEILAFAVMSRTNIESACKQEFATRPWSYDPEALASAFSRALFWEKGAEKKEVCVFHQMYVSPTIRNAAVSYKLLVDLFLQNPQMNWIPVINETKYNTNYYPIMRSIWFQDLLHDPYGYVTQYISSYQKVLDFLKRHPKGYKSFVNDIRKYRQVSRDIVSQNPEFSAQHFYK